MYDLNSILPHIAELKSKLSALLPQYLKLKSDVLNLEDEKIVLQNKIQNLEDEIIKLKKRIEIVNLTKGVSEKDSLSIGFTKTRVNTLIREIDKCISLLND